MRFLALPNYVAAEENVASLTMIVAGTLNAVRFKCMWHQDPRVP